MKTNPEVNADGTISYTAFVDKNCVCCQQPTRSHPHWGQFCYDKHYQEIDAKPLARTEKQVIVRDGTFVYDFAVDKKWWEEKLKEVESEKELKLRLYFVMDTSRYWRDKQTMAKQALLEFTSQNVKYFCRYKYDLTIRSTQRCFFDHYLHRPWGQNV